MSARDAKAEKRHDDHGTAGALIANTWASAIPGWCSLEVLARAGMVSPDYVEAVASQMVDQYNQFGGKATAALMAMHEAYADQNFAIIRRAAAENWKG